jgi:hypothetical protein
MQTNDSVLITVRSVQHRVMTTPATSIEHAIAEARRRRRHGITQVVATRLIHLSARASAAA